MVRNNYCKLLFRTFLSRLNKKSRGSLHKGRRAPALLLFKVLLQVNLIDLRHIVAQSKEDGLLGGIVDA